MKWLIGIDEVGRGPLAGPVCLGLCAAPADHNHPVWNVINGARDSKQLFAYERSFWYREAELLAFSGAFKFTTTLVSSELIDKNGISWAINSAIKRNFTKISISAGDCTVLLDGALKAPPQFKSQRTIIRGDATEPIISFASIVAKVTRDRLMTRMAITYPSYKFEINKGYGTKDHIKAIEINGPCPIHRLSFLSRIVPKEGVLTY